MKDNKLIIKCKLINITNGNNGKEVVMDFGEKYGQISFNNDEQEFLKELFGKLLKDLINNEIKIELDTSKETIKPSFLKDVSEEYIKQLNIELNNVKDHLNERFSALNKEVK